MTRASAIALVACLALAPSASAATLSGTITGGRLPAPGSGVALVRVVNLSTLEIAAADDASRRGAWSVTGVPAGAYSALTALVRTKGPVTQAISASVRARRAGRVVVRTTLKRARAPRLRRQAQTGAPTPVVQVRRLAGSGPEAQLGRGLSEMLIRELGDGDARCPIRQREGMREDAIAQELALQNSGLTDPGSRLTPRPIAATLIVRGSVSTTADSMTWSIQLVDARTGAVVGGDEGTARGADGILDQAPRQIAEHLLEQICGTRYDVALSLRTDATFVSHVASGTVSTVLTAMGTRSARGVPPTRFTGSGPLGYENLSFITGTECTLTAPVSNPGSWSVTLAITVAGRLSVSWDPEASGAPPTGTATSTCPTMPPVPVPGFPGPSLVNPDPRTFELPIDGGTQAIAGGIRGSGQGWAHSGTIVVTRRR